MSAALLMSVPASSQGSTTTFTSSNYVFNSDAHVGTLALKRPGAAAPYRTTDAFEMELRVSPVVANKLIGASGTDPRVSSGLAGRAPDGNPWITAAPDPGWVGEARGTNVDRPAFSAEPRLKAALEAQPQLAPGEKASCTESSSEIAPVEQQFVSVELTIGPGTVQTGDQRATTTNVPAGTENFNDDTSILRLQLHRLDRVCTVTASPASTPTSARCGGKAATRSAPRATTASWAPPAGT